MRLLLRERLRVRLLLRERLLGLRATVLLEIQVLGLLLGERRLRHWGWLRGQKGQGFLVHRQRAATRRHQQKQEHQQGEQHQQELLNQSWVYVRH